MKKKKRDMDMETAASLTPDLEQSAQSMNHPLRFAGLEYEYLQAQKTKLSKNVKKETSTEEKKK